MKDAAGRERTATGAGAQAPGLRVPFSADDIRNEGRRRRRLAKLIAAKLTLDLIFVCGLAAYTHAVTYRTGFDGRLEHADGWGAWGWVSDLEQPGAHVELQLFLNGQFTAAAVASDPASEGAPADPEKQGRRAFVFRFEQPRYGEYEARVYAVREGRGGARRTLQQLGDARRFAWR